VKPVQALALVVLLVGGAGALIYRSASAPAPPTSGIAIGGPFSLTGPGGKTVTDADFRGKYLLIYFGYTHCPDACPTTLGDLASAYDALTPAERARVAAAFITVDPERDTPKIMGDYAAAFGPEFIGLTGNPQDLRKLEAAFHVYAEKHPLAHGDYAMDHTSIIYVMGPDGRFVGVIGDDTKPADIARRLRDFGV